MRKLHIIDTKAADHILQEAYLANALVNPWGLSNSFYKIDLLLEHQNDKFKRFWSDRGSSLQETDEIFRLHTFLIDTLWKIRFLMNRIIAGRKQRIERHSTKDASFDILSLADQLYRSKLTNPDGSKRGKIYFSENQVSDLLMQRKKYLHSNIHSYNKLVKKQALQMPVSEEEAMQIRQGL